MGPSPRSMALLGLWLLCAVRCAGQATAVPTQIPARITEAVDEGNLVGLTGNVHPLARAEFDRGAVSDAQPLHRMLLLLQRGAEQETALRQLLDDQQSKASPSYHNWLTPDQFGKQFGAADADVQAVTQWLAAQGFTGIKVGAGRTVVEFSGNAGQVRNALHTEIHQYAVKGETHFANASDPQIPAALAPVIAGVVSLHNFPAKSHLHRLGTFQRSRSTGEIKPLFTFSGCQAGNCFGVGPADFATIYNSAPLLKGSPKIDGTGQGIAIVGESNINVQDVIDFRTMFGLPQNFSSQNVILNGSDPGVNDSESESDLDVQWSGAVAPGARIDFVTSAPTETTSGIHLSAVYIVDHNLDAVMSESFGECEQDLGATLNKFYSSLWEQAAAQGITVLLSAGDGGSAGCDDFNTAQTAARGLAVSGFASTPFNIAVGGTDFDQVGRESQFWNTSPTSIVNLPVSSSAKSYIPEVPWNDSCAAAGLSGCKSGNQLNIVAGSGGMSTIYSKPSWQVGKGVPNDNHRDLPDVSLFASNGFNGSFYIICQQDVTTVSSCTLNSFGFTFQGIGGTSAFLSGLRGNHGAGQSEASDSAKSGSPAGQRELLSLRACAAAKHGEPRLQFLHCARRRLQLQRCY
jgi:subtilase family serine protease